MPTEREAVYNWMRTRNYIPQTLAAFWDLKPDNFYHALDGAAQDDLPSSSCTVVGAEVRDVLALLSYQSRRAASKHPWHAMHKTKSAKTAYRWLNNLPVTPPFLTPIKHPGSGVWEIAIAGGTHRFYLAHYYGIIRMPFLVENNNLQTILALLPNLVVPYLDAQ